MHRHLPYLLIVLALGSTPGATPPNDAETASALVCWLTGEAEFRPTGAQWRKLELYQRLVPGSEIRTADDSEVTMVFQDGQRWVVEASSLAVIEPRRARVRSGSMRRLEPVPARAVMPPLARPGKYLGAGRIRQQDSSEAAPDLYPRDATLLIEDAVVRFTPVEGVELYRVEVIDPSGAEVFAVETEATAVRVPAFRLEPEAVYYWRVSSGDRGLLGGGFFRALGEDDTRVRGQLAAQVERSGDPGLSLLLAELDHHLGLRLEACANLPRTDLGRPADGTLEKTLARYDCAGWEQRLAQGTVR